MNQEQITNIWEQLYKNKNTELQFDDFKEYMYSILGVDKNYDDDIMIGLLNIRYEMSEELRLKYGDIGYSVRPSYRRCGYATKMLRYALEKCLELGMDDVILGCYKSNGGSIRTILNNGGKWLHEDEKDGKESLYYEIDLKKIKNNKNK